MQGSQVWRIEPQYCVEVMESLMSFPCSHIFMEPMECRNRQEPNKPPRVLSFGIIRDRLTSGYYQSTKDWFAEIWEFFRCFGEQAQSPVTKMICGEYFLRFKRRIQKAYEKSERPTGKGWLRQVLTVQQKLECLLHEAPPVVQPYLPLLTPVASTTGWVNKPQFEFVKKVLPKVKNPVDLFKLKTIVESGTYIDLVEDSILTITDRKLNQATACKLFDTLREMFPNEPVELPSPETGATAARPKL